MSDSRADRESGERLRKNAVPQDVSLQDAYLETRAALSEVRQLYFQRASAEAEEFLRLEAIERHVDGLEPRMGRLEAPVVRLEARMEQLEKQMMQVTAALSQKRSLYQRIVWLFFGKR